MRPAARVAAEALLLLAVSFPLAHGAVGARQASAPTATLLYQNFPNPFPTQTASATCIWFDLARPSRVQLVILDVRGNPILSIVPGRALGTVEFPAGRYGRGTGGPTGNCDETYEWDGRDEHGHMVPTGVYLLRLRTDDYQGIKRILFRGH